MIFHFIFALSVVTAGIHLFAARSRGLSSDRVVRISLLHLLSVQWGFGGVWIAVPHIVFPDQIAGFIGWEPGSPFQLELGFASLGIALLGILSIWLRGWFWLAPIVSRSVFLLGAGWVHVEDILARGNLSPGNAGAILFYDLAVPLLAIGLFIAYARQGGLRPDSSARAIRAAAEG